MNAGDRRWRDGGCHCGEVRVAVALSGVVEARTCTCSICTMTGHEHVIVAGDEAPLLTCQDRLSRYPFNMGVARHLFCEVCGVKSFYQPRLHPEGWSVNARCLDVDEALTVAAGAPFDGRSWEAKFAGSGQTPQEAR